MSMVMWCSLSALIRLKEVARGRVLTVDNDRYRVKLVCTGGNQLPPDAHGLVQSSDEWRHRLTKFGVWSIAVPRYQTASSGHCRLNV